MTKFNFRRISLFLLICFMFIGLFACKKDIKVTQIQVTGSTTMTVEEKQQLQVTVYPADATDPSLDWSSSDNTVATVSGGEVSALKAGTVTITASAKDGSNITGDFVITVSEKPVLVQTITVTGVTSLVVGESADLNVTVTPSNASNKDVNWSSSDNTVATVANGKVTAVKTGSVTITATAKDGTNRAGSLTIQVVPVVNATAIEITNTQSQLEIEDSLKLTFSLTPSNATDKFNWSSSDATIATVVNNNGEVTITGLKEGKVTITATSQVTASVSTSFELEVIKKIVKTEELQKLLNDIYNEYKAASKVSGQMTIKSGEDVSTLLLKYDFDNDTVNQLQYLLTASVESSIYVKDGTVYIDYEDTKGKYQLEEYESESLISRYSFDKYFSEGIKYFSDNAFFSSLTYTSAENYTNKDNAVYKYTLDLTKYDGTSVNTINKNEICIYVTFSQGNVTSVEFTSLAGLTLSSVKIEFLGLNCNIEYPAALDSYPAA